MKSTIFITLMVLLAFAPAASGEEAEAMSTMPSSQERDGHFAAKQWYDGPYFLAGIGPSESVSITNKKSTWSYGGCHLFVNLGYWAYDAFGIELGGFINYSYFEDLTVYDYTGILPVSYGLNKITGIDAHLWDSSFYMSLNVRFPFVKRTDLLNPYLRLLVGYGVSVYWIKNVPDSLVVQLLSAGYSESIFWLNCLPDSVWTRSRDRFQSDGPVFGVSIGNMFNAFNDKTVWYLQVTVLAKMYREVIAVKDGAVIPTKMANFNNINNNHIVQLHLTAGIRFF